MSVNNLLFHDLCHKRITHDHYDWVVYNLTSKCKRYIDENNCSYSQSAF